MYSSNVGCTVNLLRFIHCVIRAVIILGRCFLSVDTWV